MESTLSFSAATILVSLSVLAVHLLPPSVVALPLSSANEAKMANFDLNQRTVSAVLVFGDSIFDPGNNNDLNTTIKSNFPPYGLDFPNHKSTGRFSNGKIPGDIMASRLGVKEYLPAYVNNDLEPEQLLTGVSFASGGTGYDPITSALVGVLSMDDQIDLFKDYVGKLHTIADEERVKNIISGSVFIVCAGNDDISNTYYSTPVRVFQYDIPSYVDFMITNAAQFIEKILLLGAKKIGFIGLPPIGCLPLQRTVAGGLLRNCDENRNNAAKLYNSKMPGALQTIQNKYEGSNIVFLEIYDIMVHMIQNPTNYGLEETRRGCCGTGMFEVTALCNNQTEFICEDTTKFMFWDSYHPTERGYQIIMDDLFNRQFHDIFN